MIGKIRRIGVAVKDLDSAIQDFSQIIDFHVLERRTNEPQEVEWVWLRTEGVILELIRPTSPKSRVQKFIERRGEGLFLIGLEVGDIKQAMKILKEKGIDIVYEEPRPFPGGRKHNFIHPNSMHGVMIELLEV